MIRGEVSETGEPFVELTLVAPNGAELAVPFLVDTGFNGSLALPCDLLEALGSDFVLGSTFRLADGTIVGAKTARVDVRWHGAIVAVQAGEMDAPMLGMSMLHGSELRIDAVEGGAVEIAPRGGAAP